MDPLQKKRLPQKTSLVAQTGAVLREEIQSGVWSKWLPGELELCAQLHVSRATLRAALLQLEREGWVRSRQGKRREVVAAGRRLVPPVSNRVILLMPLSLQMLPAFAIFWIDDLRQQLAEAGYHLEIHASREAYGHRAGHALKMLTESLRPAAWVLYQSTEPMQRWLSAHGLPAVITGSRHGSVKLPSVDIDYRATCRHAAGLFLARNHRFLALLNVESGAAGDFESEQGFQEGAASSSRPGVQAAIIRHDGTVAGICHKIDLALRRPDPPTGFLISRPAHVLTAMGHLMRKGLRLPQEVALIARDDDSFLEHVVPTVARYSSSPTVIARKVSRIVLETVSGGLASISDHKIMPRFIPGETLG